MSPSHSVRASGGYASVILLSLQVVCQKNEHLQAGDTLGRLRAATEAQGFRPTYYTGQFDGPDGRVPLQGVGRVRPKFFDSRCLNQEWSVLRYL